jgi:nucleoside-diphosphate-sugar epimerase
MDSVTGQQAKIVYKAPRSVDVPRIVLNVSKLKNEIDFRPMCLKDGIKAYYKTLLNEA